MADNLDEVDKKIIKYVCSGVYSHSELADKVGVSRNTVYRRLKDLKEKGVIKEMGMAIPDFEKIGFSSVIVGLNVKNDSVDEVIDFLKKQGNIKFLWKTYANFEIVAVLMCDKRNVGVCINGLKTALQDLDAEVDNFSASPSISWEKIDFSPFGLSDKQKAEKKQDEEVPVVENSKEEDSDSGAEVDMDCSFC